MALILRWWLPSVAVNGDYDHHNIVSVADYHCQQLICVLIFYVSACGNVGITDFTAFFEKYFFNNFMEFLIFYNLKLDKLYKRLNWKLISLNKIFIFY